MFKKKIIGIFLINLLIFGLVNEIYACIGKTITIGYKNFLEQKILAEILYVIISERTGTTVKLKSFSNTQECYSALERGDVNLCIEYVGAAYSEILNGDIISYNENDSIIKIVKEDYKQKRNLIWLNLFKFKSVAPENEYLRKKGLPLTAAPVIGKETLKMFPVLPRLLNKLSKKIDESSIKALIKLVKKDRMDLRTVAQNFLKIKKLI